MLYFFKDQVILTISNVIYKGRKYFLIRYKAISSILSCSIRSKGAGSYVLNIVNFIKYYYITDENSQLRLFIFCTSL